MCMSKPKIPAPPPPQQEIKLPDTMAARRSRRGPPNAGTLLAGPTGVSAGALNTGGATLLGQ